MLDLYASTHPGYMRKQRNNLGHVNFPELVIENGIYFTLLDMYLDFYLIQIVDAKSLSTNL